MNARELEHVQSVFDAALERSSSERETFVASACGGDAGLREKVMRLLRASETSTAGGMVASAVRAAALSFAGPTGQSSRRIGAYQLLREIGHGGMGTVWLAERADTAYREQVAVKLVRGGFANLELARRFRDERQILADLRHPNIASLLDGGETADGTPYLVMEYIDGEPLTTWATKRRSPLIERLRLFRQVCDAVQHAHASLVVHRDIKPSNILVRADGAPKLLDFGIAKLLADEPLTETTELARRLTPSYASPEQIRGQRITVATDVFSLGILLYELITGTHPFAPEGTTADDVRRRVLEVEPPRASDVLRQQASASAVSPRAVAGDLDNIIAKAMRKEPEQRYASVAQLSEDIGRMLDGRPVLARPASFGYRARKFVRRHADAVTAAALVLLALVGGIATTLWQARRADRARARTEVALAQAKAAQNFLTRIFDANAPDRSLGGQITARQLLEAGARRIDSLRDQPALQAYLLETMGKAEFMLADYRQAKNMYDRELAIVHTLPGPVDSLLVNVQNSRGQAYDNLGFPDSSAVAYADAIASAHRYFGDENDMMAAMLNNLAGVYFRLGRDRESDSLYRRAIDIEKRVLAPNDPDIAVLLCNRGVHLGDRGFYGESEALLHECLRIRLLHDSLARQPSTASDFGHLGNMLLEAGRYDEAEPYLRRALAIFVRTLAPQHLATAQTEVRYGTLLAMRARGNDFTRSDSLLHAALEMRRKLGPIHPFVAYPMHALGILALERGEPRAAEGWFRQALAIRRRGTDSPRETVRTLVRLAQAQLAAGDSGVETTLREADSLARARIEPGDPVRSRAAIGLALAQVRRGNRGDGAPLYAQSIKTLADRVGTGHPSVRAACADGTALGLDDGAACPSGRR